MRDWLYGRNGRPRLVAPALALFVATTAIALVVLHFTTRRTDEGAARALLVSGKASDAEAIYEKLVRREPTVPHVLALARAHREAKAARVMFDIARKPGESEPTAPMSDDALDALFASLPADVALVGRFAIGSEDVRDDVEAAAKRDPPVPWTNHVLADDARAEGDELLAASLYWREATAFPERRDDLRAAFASWIDAGAWDEARARLDTPGVAARVGPEVPYTLALHDHDWRSAVRALPTMYASHFEARYLWLTLVAAIAWAFFCARLGKVGERPGFRIPLYAIAFALGVASIAPTFVLIALEEAKLGLRHTGEISRDLLFFVFGVGLREELSKLLMFMPLVPILRRYGDKLDVLACGAMVGLGFAAEENLAYLADENLHTGLGRFLTANFLHMAMTGILASAVFDAIEDPEKYAPELTKASLLVVGLHGAYDFLIAHHEMGGGYAAMAVFVLLAKRFLDSVEAARKRADRVVTPMHAFVAALAVVTGASLAHAIATVGARQGPLVMAEGLLGEAVIVIVFARVLSTM